MAKANLPEIKMVRVQDYPRRKQKKRHRKSAAVNSYYTELQMILTLQRQHLDRPSKNFICYVDKQDTSKVSIINENNKYIDNLFSEHWEKPRIKLEIAVTQTYIRICF